VIDAFDQLAKLDVVRQIADRNGLVVIKDSYESLGSKYQGIKCGNGIRVGIEEPRRESATI